MSLCYTCVPEGGKGGATANPDRGVDPSRLDLRIGKILSAKKVNMLRKAIFFRGKVISSTCMNLV